MTSEAELDSLREAYYERIEMARSLTRPRSQERDDTDAEEDREAEEEARPSGRRSRRSTSDEEETRPSRRRSRKGSEEKHATPGARGWAGREESKAKATKFGDPNEFKVAKVDVEYLIKFLEDAPFWSYRQHFVREIPKGGGKKQFTCLDDDDCALCDLNYPSTAIDLYNILDLNGSKPVVKYLAAGSRLSEQIEKRAKGKSTKPINREDLYFIVSKTEDKSGFNTFDVEAIKEDEIEDVEGWENKVPTEEQWDIIDKTDLFDEGVVVVDSIKAVRTAAEYVED